MPTYLLPSEYDQSYFDGKEATLAHNAGYSFYRRWYRRDGNIINSDAIDTGEEWSDRAAKLLKDHPSLTNKNLLEIGCAKGFLVEDLRDRGLDAWGLDVSQYCYDQASAAVQPYITVADVRTHLSTYRNNEWDFVLTRRLLECLDPADLPGVITQMNRICKNTQIHIIQTDPPDQWYNAQPLSWWATQGFNSGTILISLKTREQVVV